MQQETGLGVRVWKSSEEERMKKKGKRDKVGVFNITIILGTDDLPGSRL